jgi:hypothetical protein
MADGMAVQSRGEREKYSVREAPTYRLAQHLAGLLGAHIGDSPHYVRNSMEFIDTIQLLELDPEISSSDLMSFLPSP